MTTVIIDYGSGNLRSAAKAFERAARENGGDTIVVSADPDAVRSADRVVLPGVGAFADCRVGLLGLEGMAEALEATVIAAGRPFLGICVGMQLMATRGVEHGTHDGFDWVSGTVEALTPAPGRPVPHMGWNDLEIRQTNHSVLAGVETGAHAYFVHSYAFRAANPAHVLAKTDYGGPVAAVIGRDNMIGTQFHPEKSQETGLRLIANFLSWTP
jgi:glutamine amidotransferase